MSSIGFELLTNHSLAVLPGNSVSMAILWNKAKIPGSIGKDLFHEARLFLPNKRIAATGRIHYLPDDKKLNFFEPMQSSPAHPIICPDVPLTDLRIEIKLSKGNLLDPIERTTSLHFIQQEAQTIKTTSLYLDPPSFHKVDHARFHIDLSFLITKYFN